MSIRPLLGFSLLLISLSLPSTLAQTPAQPDTRTPQPGVNIIINSKLVRFAAQAEFSEWRLEVLNQRGESVFDSGLVSSPTLDWPLHNQQGEAVESGLYAYTLTLKLPNSDSPRAQRGHIILDRAGSSRDQIWVTSSNETGIGGDSGASQLTVTGSNESVIGGARVTTENERTAIRRTSDGRAVEEQGKNDRADTQPNAPNSPSIGGTGTTGQLSKWLDGPNGLLGDSVVSESNGNVGIGISSPGAKLHVEGVSWLGGPNYNSHFPWFDNNAYVTGANIIFRDGAPENWAERMRITSTGNVGIGTAGPGARLSVVGPGASELLGTAKSSTLITSAGPLGTVQGSVLPLANIGFNSGNNSSLGIKAFRTANSTGWPWTSIGLVMDVDNTVGVGGASVWLNAFGGVGIGTPYPAAKLHVEGGNGLFNHPAGRVDIQAGDGSIEIFRAGGVPYIDFKNSLGVDFDLRIQQQSDNSLAVLKGDGGGATVSVGVLQITGGSDLAEPFEVSEAETIQPGMVVVIDPEQPGRLRLADKSYDRTVAGIVSGANGIKPGLTMRQEGTLANGSLPVALTGRVYCWADASNGPIEPGDLLTTSTTLGHAMKVTNYAEAQGAIIGKAMTGLKEGKGLVLVLVTLQ